MDLLKDWLIGQLGRSAGTVGLLLAVNLLPLILVFNGFWELRQVIVLYWLENGVIGVWHVLRMLSARRSPLPLRVMESAFFCVHYGLFFLVHGMFVMHLMAFPVIIGDPFSLWRAIPRESLLMLAFLAGSHGYSTWWHFFKGGEFLTARSKELFMRPYARVIVLHLTMLGGGFVVMKSDEPRTLLILLVMLKTVVDLVMHLRSHRPKVGQSGKNR